jgi:hypothetical protein
VLEASITLGFDAFDTADFSSGTAHALCPADARLASRKEGTSMFRHHQLCLVALAVSINACSVRETEPRMLSGNVQCQGGTIERSADLGRFIGCQVIRGNLTIAGSNLEDLDAFHTLRSVSGTLAITDNPKLDDVEGLGRLTSVGRLEIRNNPELRSLSGLEGLTRLESLTLDKTRLYTASGLDHLREVDELQITDNAHLIDLGALSGIVRARSVRIERNPRLCGRLGLLSELEQVEGELRVRDNLGLSARDVASLEARVQRAPATETLVSALPTSAFGK